MARETTNAGKLGELGRFTAALAANASELPHLEGPRIRLERAVSDAHDTAQQQTAFVASKQEMSKRLKTQITEAQRVANGIRKLLAENYGIRSEKLAEFGVQPFRGRKVKSEKPEPPASPAAPLGTNS